MNLHFGMLGPLVVAGPGGPVDVGGPKQRAVLAALLINTNRPLTADQLVEAVWGEDPPARALGTLQAYVSNLRRALEPDRAPRAPARMLQTNGAGYQLALDSSQVDALRFGDLVGRAAALADSAPARARELLDEALSLWRGPALADFRYDDFAQAEIARLDELWVTAVETRIGVDLALGRSDELIPELEKLLTAHPLRERLWGHLMLALYRAGRQAEALRAFRRCEARLAEELGISPGTALRNLELAILNQDAALAGSRVAPGQPTPAGLIGRAAERRRLGEAIERARAGQGAVLLVDGEPGVGKTRLLQAMADDAVAAGFQAGFARCVEVGGAPPFWPWMQLVRQLGTDALAAAAGPYGRHLRPLLPAEGDPAPGTPLFAVADALVAALAGLAASRPVWLTIDDLYSADPDSLSLLTLVASAIRDVPVVVAGSHRGHDLGPTHPLSGALAELARLEWVDRLSLRRFGLDEVGELVRGLAGPDVGEGTIRAIHGRAEGNAFFTLELTRLLLAEHGMTPERAAGTVPATVMEVVGRRFGQLTEDALRVVRTGALCGREFDLTVVAAAADLDLDEATAAIDEALRSGLLLETGAPGTYRFSHVIVVDCVTRSLGAVRRSAIHERLAAVLERRFGHHPVRWVQIAHHRREALATGGPAPAIAALARAGEHAMTATALELAEELLGQRHALVVAEPPGPARDAAEIASLFDLARLWTWREGYHSPRLGTAGNRLGELIGTGGASPFRTGEPITADDPVLSAHQVRFSYAMVTGDVAAATAIAGRLQQLATAHPDPMVELAAGVASCVAGVHAPRISEALDAAAQARGALEVLDPGRTGKLLLPLGQQSGWATLCGFAAWARWLAGDRDAANAELAAARELCDRGGHPFTRSFCVTVEGVVGMMDGSPDRVADAIAWGEAGGDDAWQFGLMHAWLQMQAVWAGGMRDGDPAGAADRLRSSLAELDRSGARIVHSLYWGMAAELELRAGRPEGALDAARRGIAMADACGERFWYPVLESFAGAALGELGRHDEGRRAARRGLAAARELGLPLVAARIGAPAAS